MSITCARSANTVRYVEDEEATYKIRRKLLDPTLTRMLELNQNGFQLYPRTLSSLGHIQSFLLAKNLTGKSTHLALRNSAAFFARKS